MSITLDVSNYDAANWDCVCLKAAGVDRIILGCQRPAIARDMAARAKAAGIDIIATYSFLYFGQDTKGQTQAAIDIAREVEAGTVWLDCESEYPSTEGPGQTQRMRVDQLAACVANVEAAGLRAGIYTGGYWWPSKMNSTAFSHLPLWHAAYFDDHRAIDTVNYGGWTKPAMHQYTSTLDVCGRGRDANYVFEAAQEADDMAAKEQLAETVEAWRQRKALADLALDLNRYEEMKTAYALLHAKGLVA